MYFLMFFYDFVLILRPLASYFPSVCCFWGMTEVWRSLEGGSVKFEIFKFYVNDLFICITYKSLIIRKITCKFFIIT